MKQRDLGRVYVTGSDGFIGSHLVETLVGLGVQVTALCQYNSNGSYGWLNHYAAECPSNLKLILGDIRDQFFMDATIQEHNTVFHLAALIAIPFSYVAPKSYIDTNISGTTNVALACLKHKVERLIHTSTSEVYGTALFVPITEAHPLQGQSPYSASKIGADMMIDSFFRSFELPAVTLRPFNTYGPRQSLRAVIPTIIAQAVAGETEIRLGSLDPTRDFNFVSDTVNAFLAVALAQDESILGQVYNAGSGREVSIRDVTLLIGRLLGREFTFNQESIRFRPKESEVERLLADASKLRQVTSWSPKVTLEEGIVKVADWMKKSEWLNQSTFYHR
ncbi:SDR family NAD(P)-dependent oxidoreductase [Oligoflexus tunisiensis]|uniref:SDR family NAD(P)-dependent oxidoreductase n=1 Tax=Oligoflexus tunisiensis TaxID=708132 RepID=UPI000AA90122|nr:SDR family NAD(P)-dependent oxidoreductase [Oligoflexus tunisiensis]